MCLMLFCWTNVGMITQRSDNRQKGNLGSRQADGLGVFLTSWRSSLDSSLTTTPRPLSSLNMLIRSSQEKPQTICRSSPGQKKTQRKVSAGKKNKNNQSLVNL